MDYAEIDTQYASLKFLAINDVAAICSETFFNYFTVSNL